MLAVGALDQRKERASSSTPARTSTSWRRAATATATTTRTGSGTASSSRCPTRASWSRGATTSSATAVSTARAWRPARGGGGGLVFSQGFTDGAAVRGARADRRAARRGSGRRPERHVRPRPRPARGGAARAGPRRRVEEARARRDAMTTRTATLLAATALLGLAARPAAAGEIAIEAHGGYFEMAAENSASALFDSTGGPTFGGAVRYNVCGALSSRPARGPSPGRASASSSRARAPPSRSSASPSPSASRRSCSRPVIAFATATCWCRTSPPASPSPPTRRRAR